MITEMYRLSLKDFQLLYMCSLRSAQRRKKELQQFFNKEFIRLSDVARYEGYDVNYLKGLFS
jgi:hypothetical protein